MGGRKCNLLNFCEKILRISVESNLPKRDERIVFLGNGTGCIEDICLVGLGFLRRNDLSVDRQLRTQLSPNFEGFGRDKVNSLYFYELK